MKKIIFLFKQIKDLGSKIFLWSIFVVCILNSLLLAFAYRDFSWELLLMAFFSTVLLPICVWFLIKVYHEKPMLWFTSETEAGKYINHYVYPSQLKDEDEYDLAGRFCIND